MKKDNETQLEIEKYKKLIRKEKSNGSSKALQDELAKQIYVLIQHCKIPIPYLMQISQEVYAEK